MVPRNIKFAQTLPVSGTCTNSQLGQVEFLRFISYAQRNAYKAKGGFEPGLPLNTLPLNQYTLLMLLLYISKDCN